MKTFAVMTDSYGEVDLAAICPSLPVAQRVVKALKKSNGTRRVGIWIDIWRTTEEVTKGKWWKVHLTGDGESWRAQFIAFREATELDYFDSDVGEFHTVVQAATKAEAIKIAQQRQKEYPEELK
jgi:hypothetical protein